MESEKLVTQIRDWAQSGRYDKQVSKGFRDLLTESVFIRQEGAKRHFSVYFLPFNPETEKVFIVHHKKADLWLSPGGHIDKGEVPLDTLKRELDEELGVKDVFEEEPEPFMLSTVSINRPEEQPQCGKHFDIWYVVMTDGGDFKVDPREFLETRWVTFDEARELVSDPSTLEALKVLEGE